MDAIRAVTQAVIQAAVQDAIQDAEDARTIVLQRSQMEMMAVAVEVG